MKKIILTSMGLVILGFSITFFMGSIGIAIGALIFFGIIFLTGKKMLKVLQEIAPIIFLSGVAMTFLGILSSIILSFFHPDIARIAFWILTLCGLAQTLISAGLILCKKDE